MLLSVSFGSDRVQVYNIIIARTAHHKGITLIVCGCCVNTLSICAVTFESLSTGLLKNREGVYN